jgi:phosphatidylglycerol lysyltransferase
VIVCISIVIAAIIWIGNQQQPSTFLQRHLPVLADAFAHLRQQRIERKYVRWTIACSVLVDAIGIVHMYAALRALGAEATMYIASVGYLISITLHVSSPFLRGAGAIELLMTYFLSSHGIAPVQAVSVAFLFRFFQFWLPLIAGMTTFVFAKNTFWLRVFPPVLMFVLGISTMIGSLVPAR